jgi:hypothetical protein
MQALELEENAHAPSQTEQVIIILETFFFKKIYFLSHAPHPYQILATPLRLQLKAQHH